MNLFERIYSRDLNRQIIEKNQLLTLTESLSSYQDVKHAILTLDTFDNTYTYILYDMIRYTIMKDVKGHIESEQEYNSDIPIEVITTFYVNAVINVCSMCIRKPNQYTAEDMIRYLDKLIPDNLY